MGIELDEPFALEGVWVVYFYDVHPLVGKIFASEIDALREAVGNHSDVVYVPFGMSFAKAVEEKNRIDRENALAEKDDRKEGTDVATIPGD